MTTRKAVLRSTPVTARIGVWLGTAVAVCFITGLFSHFIQHRQPWFRNTMKFTRFAAVELLADINGTST